MSGITPRTTGQRFRAAREGARMSVKEVSEMFGCTVTSVSNWELGKNLPESVKLPQLAAVYGVSIDWLLDVGPGQNEEIEHLIGLYHRIPTFEKRRAMLRLIRSLIDPTHSLTE